MESQAGGIVGNTDALPRLLDRVRDDVFGATLERGHLNPQKEILPLSVEKLGSRVFYVQASDNDGRDNAHLAPGRGSAEWESVFRGLRRHGFDGDVGVDVGGVADLEDQSREGYAFIRAVPDCVNATGDPGRR